MSFILLRIVKPQTEFFPTQNSSADKVENCKRKGRHERGDAGYQIKAMQSFKFVFIHAEFLAASITAGSESDSRTLTSDPG